MHNVWELLHRYQCKSVHSDSEPSMACLLQVDYPMKLSFLLFGEVSFSYYKPAFHLIGRPPLTLHFPIQCLTVFLRMTCQFVDCNSQDRRYTHDLCWSLWVFLDKQDVEECCWLLHFHCHGLLEDRIHNRIWMFSLPLLEMDPIRHRGRMKNSTPDWFPCCRSEFGNRSYSSPRRTVDRGIFQLEWERCMRLDRWDLLQKRTLVHFVQCKFPCCNIPSWVRWVELLWQGRDKVWIRQVLSTR